MSLILTGWPWVGSAVVGAMIALSKGVLHWKSYVLSTLLAWTCMLIVATHWGLVFLNSAEPLIPHFLIAIAVFCEYAVAFILLTTMEDAHYEYEEGFGDLVLAIEKRREAQQDLVTKQNHLHSLGKPLDITWWEEENLWWADWTNEGVTISRSSSALEIAARVSDEKCTLANNRAMLRTRLEWESEGSARINVAKRVRIEGQGAELNENVAALLNEYLVQERSSFSSALFEIGLAEAHLALSNANYLWEHTDTGKTLAKKELNRSKQRASEIGLKELAQVEKSEDLRRATRLAEFFFRAHRVPFAAKYLLQLKTWGPLVLLLLFLAVGAWSNWK